MSAEKLGLVCSLLRLPDSNRQYLVLAIGRLPRELPPLHGPCSGGALYREKQGIVAIQAISVLDNPGELRNRLCFFEIFTAL